MKQYLKSFLPDFRPIKGPDASFDLRDFLDKGFKCPVSRHDIGVYIISATDGTKYIYPNGKRSPIIYIGMSDDLLRRLREHFMNLKNLLENRDYGIVNNEQLPSRYQYMFYNGSHVDVFMCLRSQESKVMESTFINRFYQIYRAIPIGNGAHSFGKILFK